MRQPAASAAIFNASGEILLVRLSYDHGQWTLPGGGIEPGESPSDAAIREVREETGLDVEISDLYGVYWRRDNDLTLFAFRCRVTGGSLRPDGVEILEVRYFPADALPRPITNVTLLRVADATADEPVGVKTLERLEYL
ncbi:MAG: NUDIX hydrolase [Armatimonadota bacterium]